MIIPTEQAYVIHEPTRQEWQIIKLTADKAFDLGNKQYLITKNLNPLFHYILEKINPAYEQRLWR